MANPEHLTILKQGIEAWNNWQNGSGVVADLREVNLIGANLSEATLLGASLIGATLLGANLREADLRGANLREANLIGADLSGADLRGVTYNSGTRWPEGFAPEQYGATGPDQE